MADAVAGAGEDDAELLRDRLEVGVVVGVLEADLDRVVVDVGDRELGLDAIGAHALELEVGHRAGGVLRERLVDLEGDLVPRRELAGDEVCGKQLVGEVHGRGSIAERPRARKPEAPPQIAFDPRGTFC